MSRKENFLRSMRHETALEEVPLWELHFHLWNKLSKEKFVSGKEFLGLSDAEQEYVLQKNAEIVSEWGTKLEFSAVSIPDSPWDCIYTLPEDARIRMVSYIKRINPDFCINASCSGVIAMPSSGTGYEEFCYRLFDEPEEIDEMCEHIYQNFLEKSKRLIEAGVDVIYMASDVADNKSPFFNREQQLRWYFPYLRKCVDFLHEQGVSAILHTDGNINMLLKDIKESGVDGLQAIDPVAGMDIRQVQEYMENKVTVCGNLDCGIMLTAEPEKVYEETKKILLSCKDKPGFVFGNSNAVDVQTPLENYMAMLDAWKEYGKIE